jgi:hypothetical protein
VRLALFDLAKQTELFRRDDFTSEGLPAVAQAIECRAVRAGEPGRSAESRGRGEYDRESR